jgi:hypothetical protein
VGLFNRDDDVLSFAHQSYFDHLVAERVWAEAAQGGRAPLEWVAANQSLFRRDQLRQLLTLLRECDQPRHAALLQSILLGGSILFRLRRVILAILREGSFRSVLRRSAIRFHLKHLALGLLRQAEPVLEHETRLVVELSRNSAWWEHILSSVIWARPPWFDALDDRGALANWLADSADDQRVRQVLRFLRSVADARGNRIDELLDPYWAAEGQWNSRLLEVLSFNPCDDSPRMAELRLSKVQSGEIVFSGLFADELARRSPERLVRLLGAAISVWVKRVREHLRAPNERHVPDWHFRDQQLNAVILGAVRAEGRLGRQLLAESLRAIVRVRRVTDRSPRTLGDVRNVSWGVRHVLDEAHCFTEGLLTASVEGMAQANPTDMAQLLNSMSPRQARGLERAITKGLVAGDSTLADRAIQWLCDQPARFRLGDGHDELHWQPARDLVARFVPHCSETVLKQLEAAILAYHDDWERDSVKWQLEDLKEGRLCRNDWGHAQNVLLGALPEDRMSPTARSAAATWRGKFGDPADERPPGALATGGWVTSPIPPNRLLFVSDREWLRIIRTDWSQHDGRLWRQHGPDVVGEASLRHFADALGAAARQNTERFAALALRMPANSSPIYFAVLLRELTATNAPQDANGWESASVADLEAIVDHVGDCDDRSYVEAVCRAVRERDDGHWSDRMLDRVVSYVAHPHPSLEEFTCHREKDEDGKMEPDVGGTAINCVRGAVAGAIAALLWKRPDAYDQLLPAAERLLRDPHPSVRHEALGACLPIWNRDRSLAVRLVVAACDHENERVLGSRWLGRLISYARVGHIEQVAPIIERMARSSEHGIAESGATWATACWLDGGHLAELARSCRNGSKAQRSGVVNAALQYFANGDAVDRSGPIVVQMFRDADRDVRLRAAGVFRRKDVFTVAECVDLAGAFVRSTAFRDDPGSLLHPLSECGGDIMRYAQVVLDAADILSGSLAEKTRDVRQRNAFAGNEVSVLLLRLYEHAYGARDRKLQEECLDRWDAMLQNRIGMTESHLRLLDV